MWTYEERKAFQDLVSRVYALEQKVNSLNTASNCKSSVDPEYRIKWAVSIEEYYNTESGSFNFDQVETALDLNDLLPLDVCPGAKGIVFCDDAVVWCNYNGEEWKVNNITPGLQYH